MNPETTFVTHGNLFSFDARVMVEAVDDLLNSNLLAQLASEKKFSRFTAVDDWYKTYVDTLGNLAWQNTLFDFDYYNPDSKTFTLEGLMREGFSKILSASQMLVLSNSMRAFRNLPAGTDTAMVYSRSTHDKNTVNACVTFVENSLRISTIGATFSTTQAIKREFEDDYLVSKLSGDIRLVQNIAILNESVYADMREMVIKRLGSKRDANIFLVP